MSEVGVTSGHARVSVHQCSTCGGLFCAGEALDDLVRTVWTRLADLSVQPVERGESPELACPRCAAALVPSVVGERPVVDRCPSCGGFWLDSAEIDELRKVVQETDDATLSRIMGTDAGQRLDAALRRPEVPDIKLRRGKPPGIE